MDNKHTIITIKEKREISLDGVINVEGFDESYVSIKTSSGGVCVEGRGLKIESLSKDNGIISISGNISGVYYDSQKTTTSIFAKIFK